jgi:enoyl-CoA hydratase/carnithine racemase
MEAGRLVTPYGDYEKLRFALHAGVATVTIDNPPLNLLDRGLFRELRRAIEQLEQDHDVRVIVLCSGVPGWFIAHYDLTLIQAVPPVTEKRTEPWVMQRMTERLRTMPKATIAVLDGRTGGGGSELAMSCDMRFASSQLILNQPEVGLGLLPGASGSQRLPRLIGRSRALEVILGCDDIDALTAERWGLVNRVLPQDQLGAFVAKLAGRIAAFPAAAVAAAKTAVLLQEGNMDAHLVHEANAIDELMSLPDTKARLQRFLDLGGQTPEGERRLGDLVASAAGGAVAAPD